MRSRLCNATIYKCHCSASVSGDSIEWNCVPGRTLTARQQWGGTRGVQASKVIRLKWDYHSQRFFFKPQKQICSFSKAEPQSSNSNRFLNAMCQNIRKTSLSFPGWGKSWSQDRSEQLSYQKCLFSNVSLSESAIGSSIWNVWWCFASHLYFQKTGSSLFCLLWEQHYCFGYF